MIYPSLTIEVMRMERGSVNFANAKNSDFSNKCPRHSVTGPIPAEYLQSEIHLIGETSEKQGELAERPTGA